MFKIVTIEAMAQPVMRVGSHTLENGREDVLTLDGRTFKVPVVVREEIAEVRCCLDWMRDVVAAYEAEHPGSPVNIYFGSLAEIEDMFAPWLALVQVPV